MSQLAGDVIIMLRSSSRIRGDMGLAPSELMSSQRGGGWGKHATAGGRKEHSSATAERVTKQLCKFDPAVKVVNTKIGKLASKN